ncbi:hypothetical protein R6Q57_029938 [Mikania cordata]
MGQRLWCIRENGEEFDYEIIYGLEQKIELDQQKLQDEFDLDIYDFDSLTDEDNDCPLKRSLRK